MTVDTTKFQQGLESPPSSQSLCVPSDSTVLTGVRGLYVDGAGDVAIMLRDDAAALTYHSVAAGSYIIGLVQKVMNTNTTATAIYLLF
ncbi:MAG TPA: hypothetical protein VGG64_08915 [Pirellulales bacterium]